MRRQNLDLASPKSYADRLFCQKLPLNPRVGLSPLSAPVDGAQNSDAFLRRFLREKAKLAPGCFRRGGRGENDRMMVDGRRLIYATEVTN